MIGVPMWASGGLSPRGGDGTLLTGGNRHHLRPAGAGEEPILRSYCAGWKKDNSGYYVEEFAELLKTQFAQ